MKICRAKLKPIFVTSYYDHPLEGTCLYKGKVFEFNCEWCSDVVSLRKLDWRERVKWWWIQKKFEVSIGRHWTYTGGVRQKLYSARHPRWFWKWISNLYYR